VATLAEALQRIAALEAVIPRIDKAMEEVARAVREDAKQTATLATRLETRIAQQEAKELEANQQRGRFHRRLALFIALVGAAVAVAQFVLTRLVEG
jgi:hypothetical protein